MHYYENECYNCSIFSCCLLFFDNFDVYFDLLLDIVPCGLWLGRCFIHLLDLVIVVKIYLYFLNFNSL